MKIPLLTETHIEIIMWLFCRNLTATADAFLLQ